MSESDDFNKSWLDAKTNIRLTDNGSRYFNLTFPDGEEYVVMLVRKVNNKEK